MHSDFYTFGEILWDCLPTGRHAGGAPFNVAAHLAQLGASVSLLSSIGDDALGDTLLTLAKEKHVGVEFVLRARPGRETGTVRVTLDTQANAAYEIVQPVAWDEILLSEAALEAVAQSRALVYGSLAARSPQNLVQLDRLLALTGPTKFFDVNLRPPFSDPGRVIALAQRADVLKLNDDEIGLLTAYLNTGKSTASAPQTEVSLAAACATLSAATRAARICVTRGSKGAAFWENGALVTAPAPAVVVRDTIGAGDAFMAGLILGLTRRIDTERVLENACRLGAYVASQTGATPAIPDALVVAFAR
jgi:fructokinase